MARPLSSKNAKDFKASILKALGAIDYESVLIRKMKDDIQKGDYTMFTTVLQLASKFVPKEVSSTGNIVVSLELPRHALTHSTQGSIDNGVIDIESIEIDSPVSSDDS